MFFWNILPHLESAPRYVFKLHTQKKEKKVVKNEIQDQKKTQSNNFFQLPNESSSMMEKERDVNKIYINKKFYKL
jgi:hypothetical protein